MSTLDIRDSSTSVEKIRFADNQSYQNAIEIMPWDAQDGAVIIKDRGYDGDDLGYVVIANELDAKNLVKSIEKAIELGWFK